MNTQQLVLYGIVALVLLFYVRRALQARSLKQYSPSSLAERLKLAPSPLLLDVRSDSERRTGSIKGTVHIPVQQLRRREDELQRFRGREIICICQTGRRSVAAALALRKLGHKVGNLKGGMAEWNFSQLGR